MTFGKKLKSPDPYRYLDHTADLAVEIRGKTLGELFINAGRAIFETMVAGSVPVDRTASFCLRADTREDLLLDWCRELLYRFSVRGFIPQRYVVKIHGLLLTARLRGSHFNLQRNKIKMEIKNATYHHLQVAKLKTGFKAIIIFDV